MNRIHGRNLGKAFFWVCRQTYSQGPDAALLPKEFLSSTETVEACQQKNAEQFKFFLVEVVEVQSTASWVSRPSALGI